MQSTKIFCFAVPSTSQFSAKIIKKENVLDKRPREGKDGVTKNNSESTNANFTVITTKQ